MVFGFGTTQDKAWILAPLTAMAIGKSNYPAGYVSVDGGVPDGGWVAVG